MNLNSWRYKYIIKVLIILSLNSLRQTEAKGKYNVTLAELTTCKEYDLHDSGYAYKDFFQVHTLNNNKLQANERLHLKFYVLTAMDAHILLAVNDRPRLMDRVYEIVIGAGGDTFSTIRTSMGRRRVATNTDKYLLSIFDPTPIEIVQMRDGNLLVYIPGFKKEPLLNFTDASALNINYISFSTFGVIPARWFYDCQFDGFESEIEQEERELTPLQRLINHVADSSNNASMPEGLKSVNFAFQVQAVSLKHDAPILKTRINLVMYWADTKLQWDPKDFDGITAMWQSELDIWSPNIVLMNDAIMNMHHFNPEFEYKIYANGSIVMFIKNDELPTWCVNRANNWPAEQLRCELVLGIVDLEATPEAQPQLEYDSSKPLSKEPVSTLSEWQFVEISVSPVANGIMGRYSDKGITQSMEGDVSIIFTIVRNSTFYKNVFTMPILACQTLIVLSFLLRGYRRGALILIVFVVISLGLMFMTKHAPPAYVPNLMIAYLHVMRCAVAGYLLHIVIMWLEMYPPKNKPWNWVMSIFVNSTVLRFMLGMRFSDSSEYVEIQAHPWREIAKIINGFSFIAINIVFIVTDVMLLPTVYNV